MKKYKKVLMWDRNYFICGHCSMCIGICTLLSLSSDDKREAHSNEGMSVVWNEF